MAAVLPAPGSVKTTLNYYLDPSQGGHTSYQIGVADYFRRKFDTHEVNINDVRGHESEFQLDKNGFQYGRHHSVEKEFNDDAQVKQLVYPETEDLIKDVTGATKVSVFSHIIRKDSREAAEAEVAKDPALKDGSAVYERVTPARFIHVDFSYDGAVQILRDNFNGEQALLDKLTKTRWGIINVWRPIKPISKDPLAVCDSRTARDEDMMPVFSALPPKASGGQYSKVSGGDGFELFYKRYREGEKWYFKDKMAPGDYLMIKIFDSKADGVTSRRCPHSAFSNPQTAADETRESIEVRALVFWENETV